jgi:hypothetical protein
MISHKSDPSAANIADEVSNENLEKKLDESPIGATDRVKPKSLQRS